MSSNLVIVAIPDENDRVWKLSSEKVPHLTLLFLGDVDKVANLDQIMQFVEHAANTTLKRFYLPVDHRGVLGADQADVLFFKKGRYDYKAIRDFRAALLQDNNIKTAYDSATQFDGVWQPHLTLGYPATPAKPIPDDQMSVIYDVCFNKIAVWTGDFEGMEFLLKDYEDEYNALESVPMDVAMSELEHFGVKGMRWGVRRADKKFEKQAGTLKTYAKIHNKAADIYEEKDLDRINNDPKYKSADFTKDSPLRREYYKKHEDAFAGRLNQAAMSFENRSGTRNYQVHFNDRGEFHVTTEAKFEHASDGSFIVKVKMEKGRIVGIEQLSEDTMSQMTNLGVEFLEHFGVKGMRWGVRKENAAAVGRAARSAGGAVGRAAKAAGRFAGDVHFEAQLDTDEGRSRVHQEIRSKATQAFKRTDLPAIKNKSEYQEARKLRNRLRHPRDPATKAYRKEVREAYIKRLEDAANSMTNVSGTRQYTIRERGWELPAEGGALPQSKYFWEVTSREVKHAEGDEVTWTVEVILDDDGFVTDLKESTAEEAMAQTVDLGAEFLAHYGVKGMKWGVRKTPEEEGGRREGIQRYLDPQGHKLSTDVTKVGIGVLVPVVAPYSWPAQVRLIRGGVRGANAKILDREEKKFEKNAMSPKNFVDIHNGALDKINRDLDGVNQRHPTPSKNAKTQKAYDDEVLKVMQDGYRASANAIGSKNRTRHLDVEFVNDGLDFKILAREGRPTPMPKRVKHADIDEEEITVEITGKIKRNATGHIVGFEFDHLKQASMAQSAFELEDLGAEFILEHYGVKGMRWGVRREMPTAVATTSRSVVPHGKKRKTKIKTEGGEHHEAHNDALKVAESRAKLKRSGTAALSNQELREVANRLQLEAQVATLTSSRGRKFVMREIETGTRQAVKSGIKSGVKGGAKKKLKKTAATAAVAALI